MRVFGTRQQNNCLSSRMGRGRHVFRACCRVPGRLPQRHAGFKRLWQKSVSACRGLACCRLRRSGAPAVRAVQHSACDFCLSQFRLSRGTGACGKLSGIDRRLVAVRPGRTSQSVRRFARVAAYKVQKAFRGLLGMPQKSNVGSADYVATPDCLKATFVKVVNQDLSRFARRVRCPSLVVCGKCDTTTPPKSAARMAKLIPQGNLQLIDGDHFTLFSRPKVFARIVREFTLGV